MNKPTNRQTDNEEVILHVQVCLCSGKTWRKTTRPVFNLVFSLNFRLTRSKANFYKNYNFIYIELALDRKIKKYKFLY